MWVLIAHSAKTCQKYNVPSTMCHASSICTIFDIINVEEQSVYNSARLDVVRNAQYWLVEMPYNDMGIDCSPPKLTLGLHYKAFWKKKLTYLAL